ncbi:pentapeptide repeat-containing protein [Streptosporangium canum]|uniref:pentapeptide repeat-containing protein n=1 Tax=Streptosporangium canum TaxID=324952 RepID=UPI0034390620
MPVTLLVGGVIVGVAWLLLEVGWSAAEATARQGAIQTALAAGAGVGAAVTLMLAFRRQRHQEHAAHVTAYLAEKVADNTKHDATERRVTDLYAKAAEQLGHDKAAVRLAGLYALERLAQDNPGHRQTIVNVICAYLRMPYTPPAPAPDPGRDRKAALRAARRRYQVARAGVALPADPAPRQEDGDREGELQVRLTAQRILSLHLRDERPADQRSTLPAAPAFWEGMSLDLTGATLIDFDLARGHVTKAVFDKATFTGDAFFIEAIFTEDALFGGAAFTGNAWFGGATFTGHTRFVEATFTEDALFGGAIFTEDALFGGAIFTEDALFGGAAFSGDALFGGAAFSGDAVFVEATFTGDAFFGGAAFTGNAWFVEATFAGDARFGGAAFSGDAVFVEATFTGNAEFVEAMVANPAKRHSWPDGWLVMVTPEGTGHLIREEADGVPAREA